MISKYYHTIKFLKPIQIRYQIWYRIRRFYRNFFKINYNLSIQKEGFPLILKKWIDKDNSFLNGQMHFLNQISDYPKNDEFEFDRIDWNADSYGKLWTYNLNYMDYLVQSDMTRETGDNLINQFISDLQGNKIGLDPYPTSIRSINWIKFFSKNQVTNANFSASLYAQYQILVDNLEYHLLGNHLLENGFSLLFGAFFFKDLNLYRKAKRIILKELEEQILKDGGHFELSPMYHQIILDRLLDSINLIIHNKQFDDQLIFASSLIEHAKKMLVWLKYMTFENGQIPFMNDTSPNIAPSTLELIEYATRLGIEMEDCSHLKKAPLKLSQSGYRLFKNGNYECILDIGPIGASYQPGHAHADTFNFVLNVRNIPIIVDPGISTYETNQTRFLERSTSSHNTVTIKSLNSSNIWSSFRVAERASVTIIEETSHHVVAKHDGYRKLKTGHQRQWNFYTDEIQLKDILKGSHEIGTAHFWFSHQLKPLVVNSSVLLGSCTLNFTNATSIMLHHVKSPVGFNKYSDSFKIEVIFKSYLNSFIKIPNHLEDTLPY